MCYYNAHVLLTATSNHKVYKGKEWQADSYGRQLGTLLNSVSIKASWIHLSLPAFQSVPVQISISLHPLLSVTQSMAKKKKKEPSSRATLS